MWLAREAGLRPSALWPARLDGNGANCAHVMKRERERWREMIRMVLVARMPCLRTEDTGCSLESLAARLSDNTHSLQWFNCLQQGNYEQSDIPNCCLSTIACPSPQSRKMFRPRAVKPLACVQSFV